LKSFIHHKNNSFQDTDWSLARANEWTITRYKINGG
jgi:hypothetical protein